jgi:hypothetical protein
VGFATSRGSLQAAGGASLEERNDVSR